MCSHRLFIMAPNRWDHAAHTLVIPLRLASDCSASVLSRVSAHLARPGTMLLVSVDGTTTPPALRPDREGGRGVGISPPAISSSTSSLVSPWRTRTTCRPSRCQSASRPPAGHRYKLDPPSPWIILANPRAGRAGDEAGDRGAPWPGTMPSAGEASAWHSWPARRRI
jgi:hypothetical protein